jgi:hypothetical protein
MRARSESVAQNGVTSRVPLSFTSVRAAWQLKDTCERSRRAKASTSENPAGTKNQKISIAKKSADGQTGDLAGMGGGLLKALQQLGQAIAQAEEVVPG